MTYDYYLRENAKSRPSFAKDLSKYHEVIWEFYRKEEEEPDILKNYRDYHAKQTLKMTHMEVFTYPVWEKEAEKICVKRQEPGFMLFDYQVRNPLNQDARTVLIL